ncbi:MAG TPA: ThuA domain-containing protein, partial [Fodinibius sp.]|nr:ThuA domain-containing protein [Fodinibius sp.]
EPGTDVSIVPEAKNHPILENIQKDQWHSEGNVYHAAPLLDEQANVLLRGQAGDQAEPTEPIAWIRTTDSGGPVFYTSLGYPADFNNENFLQLLTNAVQFLIK